MSSVVEEALARALRILEETTGEAEGASFVDALARGLALAFAADFTLVAEIEANEATLVRPLAGWADGVPVSFAPYLLRDTPCATAAGGDICVVTGDVRGRFPNNRALVEQGLVGFITALQLGGDRVLTAEDRTWLDAGVAVQSPRSGEANSGGGEGLVLVADDEAAVRTVARRVLERAGYSVCMASDGREAVAVFTARADEIVAVLLDMTMPLLRGDEVHRELQQIRPDVRVVLTSGYSDPTQVSTMWGTVGFLAKPWTPQELLTALRTVLERD